MVWWMCYRRARCRNGGELREREGRRSCSHMKPESMKRLGRGRRRVYGTAASAASQWKCLLPKAGPRASGPLGLLLLWHLAFQRGPVRRLSLGARRKVSLRAPPCPRRLRGELLGIPVAHSHSSLSPPPHCTRIQPRPARPPAAAPQLPNALLARSVSAAVLRAPRRILIIQLRRSAPGRTAPGGAPHGSTSFRRIESGRPSRRAGQQGDRRGPGPKVAWSLSLSVCSPGACSCASALHQRCAASRHLGSRQASLAAAAGSRSHVRAPLAVRPEWLAAGPRDCHLRRPALSRSGLLQRRLHG